MLPSESRREAAAPGVAAGASPDRIIPDDPPGPGPDEEESLDVWGFRDSAFTVLPNGSVVLTGSRYALSGVELPDLLPWIRSVMGIDLPLDDTHRSNYPPEVPPARENPAFQHALTELLPAGAVPPEPLVRPPRPGTPPPPSTRSRRSSRRAPSPPIRWSGSATATAIRWRKCTRSSTGGWSVCTTSGPFWPTGRGRRGRGCA